MKRIRKKMLALVCAMAMGMMCMTGCGSKDSGGTSKTKDKGDLLMESSIIKVYANENVLTFDCNNDENIDDFTIYVFRWDDAGDEDILYHDATVEEAAKNKIYSCTLPKDGDYQFSIHSYSNNEESSGLYNVDFTLKDNKVDTDTFDYVAELAEDLPELTIYGTNLEEEDLAEDTEEETEEDMEEKMREVYGTFVFTLNDQEVPLDQSEEELKEIGLDDVISVHTNEYFPDQYFYDLNDVSAIDFSIQLGTYMTITNDTTKEEIEDAFEPYGCFINNNGVMYLPTDQLGIYYGEGQLQHEMSFSFENGKIKSIHL